MLWKWILSVAVDQEVIGFLNSFLHVSAAIFKMQKVQSTVMKEASVILWDFRQKKELEYKVEWDCASGISLIIAHGTKKYILYVLYFSF